MKYIFFLIILVWALHSYHKQQLSLCDQKLILKYCDYTKNHHWYLSGYLNQAELDKISRQLSNLQCNPGIQMQVINPINDYQFKLDIIGIYA